MKIESHSIEKVYISDKDKDGKPFTTSAGKAFWKVGVKFAGVEDWYSTLAFKQDDKVMQIKEGEIHEVILETNGQYKNFKLPTRLDALEIRLETLEARMMGLEALLGATTGVKQTEPTPELVTDNDPIDVNDIPF